MDHTDVETTPIEPHEKPGIKTTPKFSEEQVQKLFKGSESNDRINATGSQQQPAQEEEQAKEEGAEQAPKEEVKEEAPKEESPKEDQKFGNKFAMLSKKEKEIREKEKALNEKEKGLSDIQSAVQKAKEDPEGLFNVAGIKYEDVVNHYLTKEGAGKTEQTVKSLQERLDQLEKEKEEQQQQMKAQQEQQKVNNFYNQIQEEIDKDPDSYDLTASMAKPANVYDFMVQHYMETEKKKGYGEVLSIKDALEQYEKQLESQVDDVISRSKKIKSRFKAPKEEPEEKEEEHINSKTLSNSAIQNQPIKHQRRLNREESIKALASKLKYSQ